jgi:hypothetical protein
VSNSRTWTFIQGLAPALTIVALAGVIAMRDEVRDSTTFNKLANAFHIELDERLDHLERPEAIIQLAQATKAVGDVAAAAELARANASAISVVQVEQLHQRGDLARQEGYLLQVLERLNVQPDPSRNPAVRPSESR